MVVVGLGAMVGFSPAPSRHAQMTVLLVMAGLVVASLWLRRRDRRAYERRLAQETAARAVAEDRLVIARELHDAVSGNLGAITVRCAVAQRLETTPGGLRAALDDVATASREATDALRRMLAVLRDESRPPTPGAVVTASATAATSAEGAPAPKTGIPDDLTESLHESVDRAGRSGVTVELDVDLGTSAGAAAIRGAAAPELLPAPVVQAAARIVSEALANTARHAGPTRARVTLRREPGLLRVAVVDDGPTTDWQPHPGAGQGLHGLHERLAALGGTLTTGPRTDAPGFAIEATLPDPAADGGQTAGTTGLPDRGRAGQDHPIMEPPSFRPAHEGRPRD